MGRRCLTLAAALLTVAGCQTITEEMPARPNPVSNIPNPPVLVVPAPPPGQTPAPTPTPEPPAPAPSPAPPDGGGDIPDNTNPVAKLTAKVYFVEVSGQIVPYPPAPVGSRIHLDVTPTDANNKHTQAKGTPRWTYSRMDIISISKDSPYNPVLNALGRGTVYASCEVDGVRSNEISIIIE